MTQQTSMNFFMNTVTPLHKANKLAMNVIKLADIDSKINATTGYVKDPLQGQSKNITKSQTIFPGLFEYL
mgnify:CR=1 FL=1